MGCSVNGHWKLVSSEDTLDDLMKAMGMNIFLRKAVKYLTIYEELKQEDDEWIHNVTSTFKNQYLRYKLGEDFQESTPDGRKALSTFTVEDNKLVHRQKATKASEVDATFTRELLDDETMHLTAVAHCKDGTDITCVRVFKRYNP